MRNRGEGGPQREHRPRAGRQGRSRGVLRSSIFGHARRGTVAGEGGGPPRGLSRGERSGSADYAAMVPFFPGMPLAAVCGLDAYLDLPTLSSLAGVNKGTWETHRKANLVRTTKFLATLNKLQYWALTRSALRLRAPTGATFITKRLHLVYTGHPPRTPCRLCFIERLEKLRCANTIPLSYHSEDALFPKDSCPRAAQTRWIIDDISGRDFTAFGLRRYGLPSAVYLECAVDGVTVLFAPGDAGGFA